MIKQVHIVSSLISTTYVTASTSAHAVWNFALSPPTMSSFISTFLFKVSRHSSGATTQTETVLSLVREETEKKEGTTYDAGCLVVSF